MRVLHGRRLRAPFLFVLDIPCRAPCPHLDRQLHRLACVGGNVGDLLYVGLTVLFFALTLGLIWVCERLMEDKP